ncbi:FKBP-type peptidyl-prolyl cis-trans isomerase [Desulfovibrio piger]|uniref:FKBP-type peptidyl-prolyl cis-trans isomerase n=1 Tax=Desulfovibrio piger TaxID=901 RepID=UPI000A5DE21C|nr:DUF6034 family protein [Desulfovibrio piger]
MAIKNGDTLRVHYTGTLSDGTVFDSSREREPLEFTMGKGMLIPGFEAAVMGHEAGETVTVTIPPSQAYGESDPELVFTVDRAQVPDHIPLTVGVPLQLSNEQGQMDVTITEVSLTLMRIRDKGSSQGTIVPVWDFWGSWSWYAPGTDTSEVMQNGVSCRQPMLTLNAVDGTVVSRLFGY